MSHELSARLAAVRLIAMDVDGVLTDGGVIYSADGAESKRFHISDGLGIQLAIHAGMIVVWITGRSSAAVERRALELGVSHLHQGCRDKSVPLQALLKQYGLTPEAAVYIGDDLNDLPAFQSVGVKFAPANAAPDIKSLADHVTERVGGSGAVREMCDAILHAHGTFDIALTRYLTAARQPA